MENYTAAQAVDDFVVAVAHQTPRIWDNLGITINVRTIRGWTYLASARGAYFGHGILGHFWARHLRPQLCPLQDLNLRAAYNAEQRKFQQAFLDAVLAKWCPEPPKPEVVQVKLYPTPPSTDP